MVNRVTLVGHLGADPEIRSTNSGIAVGNLRLATSHRVKDGAGDYREETEWHRVTCFGRTAEVMGQYARHLRLPGLEPAIRDTLLTIVEDERRHLAWVSDALVDMQDEYGEEAVARAKTRFREADERVYRQLLAEHADRAEDLFARRSGAVAS